MLHRRLILIGSRMEENHFSLLEFDKWASKETALTYISFPLDVLS